MNRHTIIGNLGKDPEIRTLNSGNIVASFSVASSEGYKDQNGEWQNITHWHNIVAWRKQAEKAQLLKKGDRVFIDGKVVTRSYENQNGETRYTTETVARIIEPVEKRASGDNAARLDSLAGVDPVSGSSAAAPLVEMPEDDLPF